MNKWGQFPLASSISSLGCLGIFICHIVLNGRRWYSKHEERFWHHFCPFSVRNRLPNSPMVRLKKNDDQNDVHPNNTAHERGVVYPRKALEPLGIVEVYLFALMPVLNNIPSWILIKTIFHSIGSVCLVRVVNISLMLGWTYRLFERWALDGCLHILFCTEKIEMADKKGNHFQSFVWMALAAMLSPTAALHFWTGITLVAAFCHMRSLEIVVLTSYHGEIA